MSWSRVIIGLLNVALPACMSFKAVKNTGALAADLQPHIDAIAYVGKLCEATMTATTLPGQEPLPARAIEMTLGLPEDADCKSLQKDANAWSDVLAALVAYGKALKALAELDTIDVEGELEGVRAGLAGAEARGFGSKQAKAAVGAAQKLVKLLFEELRRRELQAHIAAANPDVQILSKQVAAHVGQQLTMIDAVHVALIRPARDFVHPVLAQDVFRCTHTDGDGPPTPVECKCMKDGQEVACVPDAPGLRIATSGLVVAFDGWLLERSRALLRLRAAVQSFAKAHQILADDASSIGRADAEQMREILEAVREIYDAFVEAATPSEEKESPPE